VICLEPRITGNSINPYTSGDFLNLFMEMEYLFLVYFKVLNNNNNNNNNSGKIRQQTLVFHLDTGFSWFPCA